MSPACSDPRVRTLSLLAVLSLVFACTAFDREGFPCVDGDCPGDLACVDDVCVAEGEGEGLIAVVDLAGGDVRAVARLDDGGVAVALAQLANTDTVLGVRSSVDRVVVGIVDADGSGDEVLDAGGANVTGLAVDDDGFLVGVFAAGDAVVGDCPFGADGQPSILVAELGQGACVARAEWRGGNGSVGGLVDVDGAGPLALFTTDAPFGARVGNGDALPPGDSVVAFTGLDAWTARDAVLSPRAVGRSGADVVVVGAEDGLAAARVIAAGGAGAAAFANGVDCAWEGLVVVGAGDLLLWGSGGALHGHTCPSGPVALLSRTDPPGGVDEVHFDVALCHADGFVGVADVAVDGDFAYVVVNAAGGAVDVGGSVVDLDDDGAIVVTVDLGDGSVDDVRVFAGVEGGAVATVGDDALVVALVADRAVDIGGGDVCDLSCLALLPR